MIDYIIANWWNFVGLHALICAFLFFIFTLAMSLAWGPIAKREEARRAGVALILGLLSPLLWPLYLPGLLAYWAVQVYKEATQDV